MSDPYTIDTVDKLFKLLDQGAFHTEFMEGNAELQTAMRDHQQAHGGKPKGEISVKLTYQLLKSGDVTITGKLVVKLPEQPASQGVAYQDADGRLTLSSPMLRQMEVRDAPARPTAIK